MWLLTEYKCVNLNSQGSAISSPLSLSFSPFSRSASLNEATHHGALRMSAAGRLCNRKATLITPSTTTTRFSSLDKALAPQECRVRCQRTHWFERECVGPSQRRLSIIIYNSKSILSRQLIKINLWFTLNSNGLERRKRLP